MLKNIKSSANCVTGRIQFSITEVHFKIRFTLNFTFSAVGC